LSTWWSLPLLILVSKLGTVLVWSNNDPLRWNHRNILLLAFSIDFHHILLASLLPKSHWPDIGWLDLRVCIVGNLMEPMRTIVWLLCLLNLLLHFSSFAIDLVRILACIKCSTELLLLLLLHVLVRARAFFPWKFSHKGAVVLT
jgi:hypothetical protein